jgi:YD repeat-containing protein
LNGWVYKYDKANRLTKGNWGYNTSALGSNWSASSFYDVLNLAYDANGNLDYMTRNNQSGSSTNMDYFYLANTNKLDRVSGLNGQTTGNYVYDLNGNMTKDKAKLGATATDLITYDYRNLPTKVQKSLSPSGTIEFGYDGKGQRVSKNNLFYVPGADGRTLAVYDANGTLLYWNIWGLDLIGQRFWKQ